LGGEKSKGEESAPGVTEGAKLHSWEKNEVQAAEKRRKKLLTNFLYRRDNPADFDHSRQSEKLTQGPSQKEGAEKI